MFKRTGIGLFTASLILTGCGGGGGGSGTTSLLSYDGPTEAVSIADTNSADNIASTVVSLEATSTTLSDALDTVPLIVAKDESAVSAFTLSSLSQMAKKHAELTTSKSSSSITSAYGITEPVESVCESGSVSITTNSAGDTATINYSNCVVGTTEADGSVRFKLNSYTLNPDDTLADFSATFTFTDLITTDTSTGNYVWMAGGFTANFSGDGISTPITSTLTGSSLVMETKVGDLIEQSKLSNFSIYDSVATNGDYTFDHDYTYASDDLAGTITVSTDIDFIVYHLDAYPSVGRVTITGADNRSVRLTTIDNTSVTIEYDFDGNGIYGDGTDPAANTPVAWSSL